MKIPLCKACIDLLDHYNPLVLTENDIVEVEWGDCEHNKLVDSNTNKMIETIRNNKRKDGLR